MLPIRGINTDTDAAKISNEQALDIRNGVFYKNNLQNEEGFEVHSTYLVDNNLTPIGIKSISNGDKIFVCIGDTTDSILLLNKEGDFQVRLKADLGLDVDHPVDIEAQYNHKGELVIAITDDLNSPKVINLDDLPVPFSINSIEMFPSFKEPTIDTTLVEGGGSLKAGVIYVFVRYIDYDGTVLSSSAITNPISIGPSSESNFSSFEGSEAGRLTNKAIGVTITNTDVDFEKIQICIIEKVDGVISVKKIAELFVGPVINYIITGTEEFEDLTIEEAITTNIKYKTIKHLTQVDGTLYGASVTEESEENFQQYINQAGLTWVSELKDFNKMEESYKVHENIFYNKSFAHGEAYAFYIRVKLKDKGWTRAFHVPGRAAKPLPNGGNEDDTNRYLVTNFPIYNTPPFRLFQDLEVSEISRWFHMRDTSEITINGTTEKGGNFGFWENENEQYPDINDFSSLNGSEDLRLKKVRHHKFPSYYKMYTSYSSHVSGGNQVHPEMGIQKRDILGVKIDFPYGSFPPEIASQIEGYELLYAERNESNTTSLGESGCLLYSTWWGGYEGGTEGIRPNPFPTSYGNPDGEFYNNSNFNGANINVKSRESDDKRVDEWRPFGSFRLRAYNPDLLYSNSGSLPNYVEPLYIIRKKMFLPGDTGQGPFYLGEIQKAVSPDVTDYIRGYNSTIDVYNATRIDKVAVDHENIKLFEVNYVPQNAIYKSKNNRNSEQYIDLYLSSPILNYLVEDNIDNILVLSLKIFKLNIATGFSTQKLVSTGRIFSISNETVYGGDTFTGHYSYITHSNRLVNGSYRISTSNPKAPRTRFRFLRTLLLQSKININFRYEIPSDAGTFFYPKSQTNAGGTWFMQYIDDVTFNRLVYNKDYSSINNINAIRPYDYVEELHFVGKDNHKIIRSNIRNQEERNPSWRRFGANDYFIIPRDKGVITNIQGVSTNLFVNTENSLFISSSNEELNVEGTSALLGSGDIFGRSFRELNPDELGYSGCQHKHACLLTPLGYFFIDVEKRRIFVSDGQSVKDVNNDNNIFFQDNLDEATDNPYVNSGYTVCWDDKYSRIILSKLGRGGFTRSLYPALNGWLSRHDYNPNVLYNDRRDVYSLKDGIIYQHNKENYGQFYDELFYPFHIVGVFNEGGNTDKLLTNINWNTEVYLDEEYLRDTTFDSIMTWTRFQSTGEIELVTFDTDETMDFNYGSAKTRRKKSNWQFNSLRDIVINSRVPFVDNFNPVGSNLDFNKDFYLKRKLTGTFFIYKLLFNNRKISKLEGGESNPRIEVLDINSTFNLANR